jgi:pyruvate,water dikinase
MFQLTAGPPMPEAGGRLFVDVTQRLASPTTRSGVIDVFSRSDPLMGDALRTVVERGDLVQSIPDAQIPATPGAGSPMAAEPDPALVPRLIARTEASIATLRRDIATRSGPELFAFIRNDIQELKRLLFDPDNHVAIMAAMEATWWLNDHLLDWLGEPNAADALTRSAPGNVTSEMGLALLDVADAIRPHPAVVALLERVEDDDGFLADLDSVDGGPAARRAIEAWLDTHGMRCVGEIDITRPRWSERPAMLVPLLLANVRNFAPGEHRRRVESGAREAERAERDILERLRAQPDGARRAADTKRMIDRLRSFVGYREHPKYGIVARYLVYKRALLAEAERLVQAGVIGEAEDVYFLSFTEFEEAVAMRRVDAALIQRRKADHEHFATLTPPRVLTSEGEVIAGRYRREVPPGALVGLAVSSGVVEGRARVIADIAGADVQPGDILVTAHTDPSWTPVFVTIAGLVTEVGGLMTHGAVIAREYGLPAVVGVEDATRLIRDGQRIRVDGTRGLVEPLAES